MYFLDRSWWRVRIEFRFFFGNVETKKEIPGPYRESGLFKSRRHLPVALHGVTGVGSETRVEVPISSLVIGSVKRTCEWTFLQLSCHTSFPNRLETQQLEKLQSAHRRPNPQEQGFVECFFLGGALRSKGACREGAARKGNTR